MSQSDAIEAREEKEPVRVTVEQEGAPDETEDRFEKRVQRVRRNLDENETHRGLFVTDSFDYLAREGLLEDADEVRFSLEEGTFADLALVQSLSRRQPEFGTQRAKKCIAVQVCITIVRGGTKILVCVRKHF